ncbi:enoyl-CoA hydratase/isomerase family protein [Profundibacterium mesophilum]|uniref:3-hydroxyisobutyryl-CoA hydrolase n=1 Tax=Profundibacterium mesophilum KAUST100406-0324 TaxID=1037889 RepID=A0A921NP03_9RHOB|nr:enoyl-CoA hydratase/isomerase family protein [Profundibacterium mesophilum]KAF0674782.1 enoyl-CoA hydratase [Profundibacterium mesophilum KAUST100406-0324]
MSGDDVLLRRSGKAGRITLNRPAALNALSPEMSRRIEEALAQWARDPQVRIVLIDAAGEKAFCAGGDIADIHARAVAGDLTFARSFWRQEYRMNLMIARYGKPVISLLQGFTMGGGVGLGCHAAHRIVCESSRIAMPECAIGLVPDVGGSRLLGCAPGECGAYLGLTGARMGPADAIHAGFADMFIPAERWGDLVAQLERDGDADALRAHAADAGPAPLAEKRDVIDRTFGGTDIAAIRGALHGMGMDDPFAEEALAGLSRASPLSAAVALALVRRSGAAPGLVQALELEFRATYRLLETGDFVEGIRAMIIDKDRKPNWRHADAAQVSGEEVASYLAPLGPEGLELPE